jgi:hypothetical protein
MTKTLDPRSRAKAGYTLGRKGFAKISAVEGIRLSPQMEERFSDFDRRGLSASERRALLKRELGKKG